MVFQIPKQPYSGQIGETTVGAGGSALRLGGTDSYPFHLFEGKMPNPPKIAMEVWDYDPSGEWPPAAVAPFKDVISSPEAWAKKCVGEYGADMIVLQLKSTDPNGRDRSAEEAAQVAKKVADAVDVPLIVWGTANNQKDEDVLKKISETCQGKNIALAPVEEGNHKGIGASALAYRHCVVASSPIDVNLAKQLNILLGNLGVRSDKILIDPTTGGLGYGLEYSYSVMERIRMAALTQEDDKLQVPMISNIGNEVWKCKEAAEPIESVPIVGDPERRAILMEAVAAVSYLMSGADIVILRHPESVRLTRSFIGLVTKGGSAFSIQGISKRLEGKEADLLAISPKPNLDFGRDEAAPKKKAATKSEEKEKKPKAAAPKRKEKVVELKPKTPVEPGAEAEEEVAKPRAEEAKANAEAEVKAKAEAEARKKAEEEAKAAKEARAKAEQEAKAKAEAEAKRKAEADARAKEEDDLQALRLRRSGEREKLEAERRATTGEQVTMTPASQQLSLVDRLIQNLDRIHRRV